MAASEILFLVPYPLGRAPSQRFRVENLLPLLADAGLSYRVAPFMDEKTWNILYQGGGTLQKAVGIAKSYLRRLKTVLLDAPKYNQIFIHREAAPLGPPIFEWYLAKVLRKKIIYDFDDAIWIPNTSAENALAAHLKAFWKVGKICKWSRKISAGNAFLADFALQNAPQSEVVRVPTVVDTESRYNQLKAHHSGKPVVGWTGSHSTLVYLESLLPIIRKLQETLDFTFLVIADKKPDYDLRDWQFVPWNAQSEIEDLLKIDIGLMPLTADKWSEGKCGFKLIQYLSLGIPAVASPVGVNKAIISEGENGYLCESDSCWETHLSGLISHPKKRELMGRLGREKIVNHYSIRAITADFIGLFA